MSIAKRYMSFAFDLYMSSAIDLYQRVRRVLGERQKHMDTGGL
jgi:hypothetical protein